MGYIHALEILPEGLIEEIQEYVDGQVIYIPKIKSKRCKWEKRQIQKHISKKKILKYTIVTKTARLFLNCQRNIF